MKRPLSLSLLLCLFSASAGAFDLSGFDAPESVQVDPETGTYYISSIQGDQTGKDGNGYISKVAANGNTVIRKFIGGKPENPVLDAPKGLVITPARIYVADIDRVKGFDKVSRRLVADIDLSAWKVEFLNDLAVDGNGVLYVSDMLTNRIFKIDPKKEHEVTLFVEDARLGGPNGMVVNPRNRNLMVVTWEGGRILEVDPSGRLHVLKRGLKALDGIDYDADGNLYVASFDNGEIYRIPMYGRGPLTTFLSGLISPADLSCDRAKRELLVPLFKSGELRTFPLPKTDTAPLSDTSLRPKIARR